MKLLTVCYFCWLLINGLGLYQFSHAYNFVCISSNLDWQQLLQSNLWNQIKILWHQTTNFATEKYVTYVWHMVLEWNCVWEKTY